MKKPHSLFFPLLLIGIGSVLLASNLGLIQGSGWDLLLQWWPALLILGGLDGLYKRDGIVGPVVLLGLGTVLLLGNLSILPLTALETLWRFWPVLLIAFGLEILLSREHAAWATVVRVLVGLALVAGILWLALSGPGMAFKASAHDLTLDAAGATSMEVNLSPAAGKLELGAGPADKVVDGKLYLSTGETITSNTEIAGGIATVEASSNGFIIQGARAMGWDVNLNPKLPLSLITEMGAGRQTLHLGDLNVTDFTVEAAVGTVEIYLGNQALTGVIDSAVGDVLVFVPQGAAVKITLGTALTILDYPDDYTKQGDVMTSPNTTGGLIDLDISQAVGRVKIAYLP